MRELFRESILSRHKEKINDATFAKDFVNTMYLNDNLFRRLGLSVDTMNYLKQNNGVTDNGIKSEKCKFYGSVVAIPLLCGLVSGAIYGASECLKKSNNNLVAGVFLIALGSVALYLLACLLAKIPQYYRKMSGHLDMVFDDAIEDANLGAKIRETDLYRSIVGEENRVSNRIGNINEIEMSEGENNSIIANIFQYKTENHDYSDKNISVLTNEDCILE